jgi:cell division GTPase FtsZ
LTSAAGGQKQHGAAFVLGSSMGSPGGATLMLQLLNHYRRQGHFVVAALTGPFGFEGARKLEQAHALMEALEQVAHLVVSDVLRTCLALHYLHFLKVCAC